jgi:two-component system CheB/CheR fusion protein
MKAVKTHEELLSEINELRLQLEEANDTIEAIRTGQVDALVVHGENGHELYTLKSADLSYRVFIEKMIEGALTVNQDHVILYSNSRFASMVNTPLSQVIGFPLKNFISKEFHHIFDALFQRGFNEDCKEEITLSGKDKSTPCQLSLTRLELEEGVCLSIIVTDLTHQKEAQKQLKQKNDQLEQTNRALELSNIDLQQFAYVASHDLQEPLRKIQMFSAILNEKHTASIPEAARAYLGKIFIASRRMKALIEDILNYSRISASYQNFAPADLNKIISELLDDFDMQIKEKEATVTVGNFPEMEVIAGQIRQVFQNIISNSLKFSRPDVKPIITITPEVVGEYNSLDGNRFYCHILIRDNGIGFENKYSSQVFTLFQRLHTKDKYEGTGIGLAISKKIIEKHNGTISVNSKEGVGTEFKIILPLLQTQPAKTMVEA